MIDDSTSAERFSRTPRPLNFIRVRYYRGGQIEFIRSLLDDEKNALYDDLGKMRDDGLPEDDPKVAETRGNLRHLINALRDIDQGYIELVGTGSEDG